MVRNQIMSGELAPGAQVPALRELTRQLGVARMTVVQAMNTLEDEGLIERQSGRGTFVKQVKIPNRHTLHMKTEISQIHAMVSQLEVSVLHGDTTLDSSDPQGRVYRCMQRIHNQAGKPFCWVDIRLDDTLFALSPERFSKEIVVSVLKDIGVPVASARQKVTIAYADFELAHALNIKVNSAVFRVFREFFDNQGVLIYSAKLSYPGDMLELEIDFSVDQPD